MAKKKTIKKKVVVLTENQKLWKGVRQRITNNLLSRKDFETVCKLHAEEFKHKFYKFCTCNKKLLKQWIKELDDKLTIN